MNKERILSYKMSQKLTKENLAEISAAGLTNTVTGNGTYTPAGWDGTIDAVWDA
jgi:hypothetical protein